MATSDVAHAPTDVACTSRFVNSSGVRAPYRTRPIWFPLTARRGGERECWTAKRVGRDLADPERLRNVVDGWTDARGHGRKRVEIEAVDPRRVAAHHGGDLVRRDVRKGEPKVLAAVRPTPFLVGE